MAFYADLHVHSRYSRATSRDCDLEHLAWWAGRKGIGVVGTGDFTHPAWLEEIREKLVPAEPGLFRLRDDLERERLRTLPRACRGPVRFLLSVEISTIYKKGERTRKIHHLVYAPDLETVERFNRRLGKIGNLASDGRPILGLDSRHLLEIALESGEGAYLVPAHVWTPWFAALGSMSGFDAVAECYEDLAPHVFAVETGLSSDPPMNWRVSSLDRYRLVSNSDAHSPPMLGREACVFTGGLDYFSIRRALETGEGYGGTVEFFPEEGKYHLDGHRRCAVRLSPAETRSRGGLCPSCGRPVTVGVLSRVEELADREEGAPPPEPTPFRSLVPLPEVVSELAGVGSRSKRVARDVAALVDRLGPELEILERRPLEDLERAGSSLLAEAIGRLRRGEVLREAGFDGEYGVIRLFRPEEIARETRGGSLFERSGGTAALVPVAPRARAGARERRAFAREGGAVRGRSSRPKRAGAARPSGIELGGRAAAPDPLEGLDEAQRRAASCTGRPVLVVAGPGAGKTRTLVRRLAFLVAERSTAPERCLVLTFTRRAAAELRSRLEGLLGARAERVTVTTFHGLGRRILDEQRSRVGLHRGFRIATDEERAALVRELFGVGPRRAERLLEEISRTRRGGVAGAREVVRYRSALWERDLVDFDDLIERPLDLLESEPDVAEHYRARFPSISVDEYQDVDERQARLLRALAGAGHGLFAIGDPDQAIYGFRGADVRPFLRFAEDYPGAEVLHLERSYRSSPVIVAGALQAVARTALVPGRKLSAAAAAEAPARIEVFGAATEREEAERVAQRIEQIMGGFSHVGIDRHGGGGERSGLGFSDFAVLYRTAAQAEPVAAALERAGIPHQVRTHERLRDDRGVALLLRELRGSAGPTEDLAELVRRCADRLVEAGEMDGARRSRALELLDPLVVASGGDLEALIAAVELGAEIDAWDPRAEGVSLLTLHAAKGLEFEVVFLVGAEDGLLPLRFGAAGPPVEEERRLLFVGMTRARSRLHLSWARRRRLRGAVRERGPSPFLRDLEEALLARVEPRRRAAAAGRQLSLL